jgi:diguanylate cyclase (GGDEF)-like protein
MQSDLIIKENELINPKDYPESEGDLIEDFNRRIKRCMGVITALSKEYHTIWIVRISDMAMSLYRTTGENTSRAVVELGLKYQKYDKYIKEYIDRYVVSRNETMLDEVGPETILSHINDGSLYTVDYMRMADDGEITYHQMAFALSGAPGEAESFVFAYKDVDSTIKKHIADKRYLRDQLDMVQTLSRDYYNVFRIDPTTGNVVIVKLDGYVTKGMEGPGAKLYPYPVLCKQYIKDRAYEEDQPWLYDAMSLETIKEKLKTQDEYVSIYRGVDKGEIHYYQFTYVNINPNNSESGILAGFKNADDIVESTRERESLQIQAKMDIMSGLLNRGTGEKMVIEAIKDKKDGMLCIVDIDKFKGINDKFGHLAGDRVICGIADILNEVFTGNTIVFRLGGDEYAVYAMNVGDEPTGTKLIQEVFDRIKQLEIEEIGDLSIFVSAGAVMVKSADSTEFEEWYKKADTGVYESKKQNGYALTFM